MSDSRVKLEEARRKLPLKRLMEQRGRGPGNENWKSFPKCPYCGHEKSAGIYSKQGVELFKCHHTSCPTGCKSLDEVGILEHEMSLSRRDAFILFLKEAGVWKEAESHAPSIMPGKAARKLKPPLPPIDLPPIEPSPAPPSSATGPESETRSSSLVADDTGLSARSPVSITGEAAVPGARPDAVGAAAPPADTPLVPGGAPDLKKHISAETQTPEGQDAVAKRTSAVPPVAPSLLEKKEHPLESVERWVEYIGRAEKRHITLLEIENAVGFKRASEIIAELQEKGIIAALSKARGDHKVLKRGVPVGDAVRRLLDGNGESAGAPPGGNGNGNGAGAPPGPPVGPDNVPPPPSPAMEALRWFYTRLHWSDADREAAWQDRGLSSQTCMALGYRSNPKANKDLLEEMAKHFTPAALVESGLWVDGRRPTDKKKPNPQFYGMSLVEKRDADGRKVKDENDDAQVECVWNNPVLIPYFDVHGDLIHLRPHKGMMREKSPRLYVARPCREWLEKRAALPAPPTDGEAPVGYSSTDGKQFAIITEGEFKAGAIWQMIGNLAAVGALPGITMAKPLFGDIEEWLEGLDGVRQVVIGYDNEEKGNPDLPGYKREEYKRFDAQVWARFLARRLAQEGYDSKVAQLPDGWRDEKGKADWDGYLSRRIDQLVSGLPAGVRDPGWWNRIREQIRNDFLSVIQAALPVHQIWQSEFFDSKEERIIRNQLERISYEPKLPIGGDQETAIARRLQRLTSKLKNDAKRLPGKRRGFLIFLAQSYLALKGRYYQFKALREPQQEEWFELLSNAQARSDVDIKRACEIALKGVPQAVTDFYMKAHYVLKRQNGSRCRMVTLHNVHGVNTPLIALPSEDFAQPTKFRAWLLNASTAATWIAGERELQALQADVGREVAYKDVAEVAVRGFHEESKLWFFKDVAYTPEGRELFADRSGILWYDNLPYKLADKDHEEQSLRHGEPKMHPEVKATDQAVLTLFQKVSSNLVDTIGGFGGLLALGTVLSYGAGPEIYEHFVGFPGLWLHGETRQGKSSVARWLMRIWGIRVETGMALLDSTKVGLSIVLQQYSSLPTFLEEYQPSAPAWMTEKIKNIFDRVSGSKKTFDEGDRKIRAGAIVTGVATSVDAQVKSRYAHVLVSEANRLANHFEWFETESKTFFLLGRFILRHRKTFAAHVVASLREWLKSSEMQGIDPRARIVHGAAFAGVDALAKTFVEVGLSAAFAPETLLEFRKYLVKHCATAVQEVHDQVNVNQFWRELLDALKSDAFGVDPGERNQIFKVVENPRAVSPVSAEQNRAGAEHPAYQWKSYLLYFQPGAVIDKLRKYKRAQGRDLPLDRSDLRAQMRTRKYWVDPTKRDGTPLETHRQKFGRGSKTPESCWCVDLDLHELGWRPVDDEEFKASMYKDGDPSEGLFLLKEEWIDPRRGDLFALVDALKQKPQEGVAQ